MAQRSINHEPSAVGNDGLSTFNIQYNRLNLLMRTTVFAAGSLYCWHEGEDVATETYLRIHRQVQKNPHYITHDRQLTSIAFKTTSRLCCDVARRRDRNSVLSLDDPISTEEGLLTVLANTIPDRRSSLNGLEAELLLEQLLSKLPEQCRAPLALVGVLGMDQRKAADVLGLSLPAFKSRLYRGRSRLQSILLAMGADEQLLRQ